MKKILKGIAIIMTCLTISVATVGAIEPRWTYGTQFNEKGLTINKEVTRNGNFYNGLVLLEKYTEGTMQIELSAQKKVLGIWANIKDPHNVMVTGTGSLNNQIADQNYNVSKSTNVRLRWIQKTTGHLAADLRY